MEHAFDPYYHWLGIWPHEQPADLYRLLGLERFESNPSLIDAAADQRMAHVHQFRLSPQAVWSQRVMNELSFARITLLDPARRAAYDVVLRSMAPAQVAELPMAQVVQPVASAPVASPVIAVQPAMPPASPLPSAPLAKVVHPSATPSSPVTARTSPAAVPTRAAASGPKASSTKDGDWAVGSLVGRFKLLEKVSNSALAFVFKAQDTESGRLFFLKHLPATADGNVEVQKRFQREIEIVTRLDHPNLIAGRETGTHEGRPYLVMDYVMGADLGTLVQQQGRLSVDDSVTYLAQAARGLGQLHAHGVYHRNVKPQVLLVDVQGVLRITNLLLAKLDENSTIDGADAALTIQGEKMGTFDYVAPEQATDARAVDARSDLYALGCTLCFLLTGRPPYPTKKLMEKLIAHSRGPIPSLRSLRDDVPEWLDALFQKLLAKQPADRFQSTAELLKQLESRKPDAVDSAPAVTEAWWQRLLARIGLRRSPS